MKSTIFAASLMVLLGTPAFAASDVVETYKEKSFAYSTFKISYDVVFKIARNDGRGSAFLTKREHCELAQAYDRLIEDVKSSINHLSYLCRGDCNISKNDLPLMKGFLGNIELEFRNHDRRCR